MKQFLYEDEQFLGEIQLNAVKNHHACKVWNAEVCVNGKQVQFKLDSGADVSVIPFSLFQKFDQNTCQHLERSSKTLLGPCNYRITCKGKFKAKLSIGDKNIYEDLYVVEGLERPLLSRHASSSLNLIQKVKEISSKTKLPNSVVQNTKQQILNKYPKHFEGLGELNGEYSIMIKPNAEPYALNVPRKVPLPLLDKTKRELEKMLDMGVISRVHGHTSWCAPMVVIPKSNGEVRICVDLTKLNTSILREVHPLPSVDYTLAKFGGAKIFSKMDANSAFWQRKLSKESRLFTTFITPWGRFCFNRLPYGISTGSEQFQKCMNELLEGLEGVEVQIDDIIVYGVDELEHNKRLDNVLQRLLQANITLNKAKCEFGVYSVKILGHIVSSEGITPDPSKIKAIVSLSRPNNVKELRSFLGMVNQMSKFTSHLASLTKPLRDLLCKESKWTWGPNQEKSFLDIKHCLVSSPVLALYDPNRELKINADASSFGIGGVLLQKQNEGVWKPVSYMSRALSEAESRYSQIEKECLAFTWMCERSSDYILGKAIVGEIDHKPLVPLLTKYTLEQVPPRIQRFRMRLMRFNIRDMKHVPGKEMYTSDMLSRQLTYENTEKSMIDDDEMVPFLDSIIDSLPVSDVKLQQIIAAQAEDTVCSKVKEYILDGWPDKYKMSDSLKPYWNFRGELSVVGNLILKSSRILIPSSLRLEVMDKIHEGHQDIVKCRARAKQSVWWPGLSREIQDMIHGCRVCLENKANPPEPLIPSIFPERPWQEIGIDFFYSKGRDYLLIIDYFSRFIEVVVMQKSKKADAVISALKETFARYGIPEKLRSDNGPPFDCAEFTHFAKQWDVELVTSSPRYPQSNGEVERAVQTIKNILKKEKELQRALLAYRTTPLRSGFSPAELLMGRKLRSAVPTFHKNLIPKWPDMDKLRENENIQRMQQQQHYNIKHRARFLPQLSAGTSVAIANYDEKGIVQKKTNSPRQYVVQTPISTLRRNRVHLVPLPDTSESTQVSKDCPEVVPDTRTFGKEQYPLNVLSRPKRTIKPSLKVRENLENNI